MSYAPPTQYPFTLTWSNQTPTGLTESEMHFEGHCYAFEDDITLQLEWEVLAFCTGFTQYRDGKVVNSVTGILTDNWTVYDLEAFEKACVDKACDQFKYKQAA